MEFIKELEFDGRFMSQEELQMLTFLLRYEGDTRKIYGFRLKLFWAWCAEHQLSLFKVERVHAELYVHHLLSRRNNKPQTIAGTFGTLKKFYEGLLYEDLVIKNPFFFIRLPRVHDHTINRPHLNRTQFNDLWQHAMRKGNMYSLMVLMLGVMGLRASELCSLTVNSVSGEEHGYRMVEFIGKGAKPARLPMPVLVVRALEDYLGEHSGSGPLFLTRTGKPYTRGDLYRNIKILTNEANVPVVSPHALRRSMVTNSLNAGADIREVQKSARHSDIRTTSRIYDRGTAAHDSSSFNVLAGYIAGAV